MLYLGCRTAAEVIRHSSRSSALLFIISASHSYQLQKDIIPSCVAVFLGSAIIRVFSSKITFSKPYLY